MIDLKERKYFYFTQNSLKTFTECPFKFKKRYIDNIKWDTSVALNPQISFGLDFHKIAERYFLGIPVFPESFKDNENLYNAYNNLINRFKLQSDIKYLPEYTIRFIDNDVRLEANIDLLIVKPDNSIEIWDFKTNANLEKGKKYLASLQTKVYLYTVAKNVEKIFGFPRECDKIKMIYYSPETDTEIAVVNYTENMYQENNNYINNLIAKIFNYDYSKFSKEAYIKSCEFCEFNLFCSSTPSIANEFSTDFDLNDIEEFM